MHRTANPSLSVNDIRHRLDQNEPADVIFPLSVEVTDLARDYRNLTEALVGLLDNSEVLYESACAASVMVFGINDNIVVKAGHEGYARTEHQTLTFLQEHMPAFSAPKPYGLIRVGVQCFLFTSRIPGVDLEKAWPQLNQPQKQDISHQIDILLAELRSLPFPKNTPLGAVAGGNCRDLRRSQRISTEPFMSVENFEDFIFNGSKTATPLYAGLLRNLMPESTNVVFTHGDIRPANIMVRQGGEGLWRVTAIIDWESSGFYPEYWEAVKATNLLTPRDHFDWYNFLPQSISPNRYSIQWLVDRLWDRSAINA